MTTYTATTTEFAPRIEVVTAQIDVRMATGENFTGPMACGYIPDDHEPDVWIEQEGRRVQFPSSVVAEVVKQLKRAAKVAGDHK